MIYHYYYTVVCIKKFANLVQAFTTTLWNFNREGKEKFTWLMKLHQEFVGLPSRTYQAVVILPLMPTITCRVSVLKFNYNLCTFANCCITIYACNYVLYVLKLYTKIQWKFANFFMPGTVYAPLIFVILS